MLTFVQLLPAGVAALVLAAHFLFHGNPLLTLASLAMCGLLFVRRAWAARTVQVFLLLGSLEWLRTLIFRMLERKALGQPYLRFAFILGTVAVGTAAAALMFRSARLRQRFGRPAS
jgi:hypothetical protein